MLYTLLTGYKLKREKEVVEEQVNEIENASEECKSFLRALLSENPEDRPTIDELKERGDELW